MSNNSANHKAAIKVMFTETVSKTLKSGPGQVAQLVKALSCTPTGCGFDSQSGHIPSGRFHSGWGVYRRQRTDVFISLSLSVSLSLS